VKLRVFHVEHVALVAEALRGTPPREQSPEKAIITNDLAWF
jgi:hypothetical protein